MPWFIKTFINLMWPFVDPLTKKKVKFGTDIVADGDVASGLLLKECGGELDVSDRVVLDTALMTPNPSVPV